MACPVTGLTPREVEAIRETTIPIRKDVKGVGVALFTKLYTMFPNYKVHFDLFKDVPTKDLANNVEMKAFSPCVVHQLLCIVDLLDDPDVLIALLHRMGNNHRRMNIPAQAFVDIKAVLMELFKDLLGGDFNAEKSAAWEKMMDKAFPVVMSKMG